MLVINPSAEVMFTTFHEELVAKLKSMIATLNQEKAVVKQVNDDAMDELNKSVGAEEGARSRIS